MLYLTIDVPLPRRNLQFVGRNRFRTDAIGGERCAGIAGDVAFFQDMQPHHIVFVVDVLDDDFSHFFRVVDAREVADDIAVEQRAVCGLGRCRDDTVGTIALLVDFLVVGIDDSRAIVAEKRQLLLQFLRKPEVVAVEKGDETTFGGPDSHVSRRRGHPNRVVVEKNVNFRVLRGVFLCNFDGIVRRTILDDEQFPVLIGLRKHRLDGRTDKPRCVVHRHYDRHQAHVRNLGFRTFPYRIVLSSHYQIFAAAKVINKMRSKEVISKKIANFVGEISKHQTMRTLFCSILTLFLLVSDGSQMTISAQQPAEYQLVFSDEFNQPNGSRPDPAKWTCHEREPVTWARWISNSPKVAYIKNGSLVCRAIPNKSEPSDTARMLTGAVCTKGKFEFQYGKVEVRMKTNSKAGNFPAAWLFKQYEKGNQYGEIDIVEMFGKRGVASHAAHSKLTFNNPRHGQRNEFQEKTDVTKWHVYGIEWTPEYISWSIDGTIVAHFRKSSNADLLKRGQWSFDFPFYLILNQSVGNGEWGNYGNTRQTYETRFDWIRVWQRK